MWEALNAKSALPATAVATLAKLANAAASDPIRAVVDRAAALVGEAFWIVDDLVDSSADWEAVAGAARYGSCSTGPENPRPRRGRGPAVAADRHRRHRGERLGQVLAELAALPGASERTLLRPVQAAVRSWVEEIPAEP